MEENKPQLTVKERLKAFVASLGISEREFCRRLGVSSAYIESIKLGISPKVMHIISMQYPRLNPVWLMLGQGEMLTEGEPAPVGAAPSETLERILAAVETENARLLSIIEGQQRTIEVLAEQLKKGNGRTGETVPRAAG